MTAPLIDTYGRLHNSLRISVTDRCSIRCFYCMPETGVKFISHNEILRFEEIERVARAAAGLGVTKLRITGGEPLVRKGLPQLVKMLVGIEGIDDVALTTNAVQLAEQGQALFDAGLRRLNIHLDTLDRARFEQITRRDELDRVRRGIDAALRIGFQPIKINAVAIKGLTEPDIVPLARFGREHGIEIRYIEFMPLDAQGLWARDNVLLADEILATLNREFGRLEAIPDADPRAPAMEYGFPDGVGRVGFIASVSHPFCLNCNRLRLTADGHLRYCLFAVDETDIMPLIRGGAGDAMIAAAIQETVRAKWLGHEINQKTFIPPPRPMYAIGG